MLSNPRYRRAKAQTGGTHYVELKEKSTRRAYRRKRVPSFIFRNNEEAIRRIATHAIKSLKEDMLKI